MADTPLSRLREARRIAIETRGKTPEEKKQAVAEIKRIVRPGHVKEIKTDFEQKAEQPASYYEVTPEVKYLITHAEPREAMVLAKAIKQPAAVRPEGFAGPLSDPTQRAYPKAYSSLSESEKQEYGYTYTKWGEIPVGEKPGYYGFERYYKELPGEQKESFIAEYQKSPEFKTHLETPLGREQISIIMKSEAEKRVTEPVVWDVPFFGKVKQPAWMAQLNIAAVTVEKPGEAKTILARSIVEGKNIYEGLGFRTRSQRSYAESGLRAVTFPVTLPQQLIKLGTGKQVGPDIIGYLEARRIAPTKGVISGTIGTVLGDSSFMETAQKYPLETAFAGLGELHGFAMGGYGLRAGKIIGVKALGKLKTVASSYTGTEIPISYSGYVKFATKYSPINIIRTGKWQLLKKLGKAQEVKPEYIFQTKALPGKLSFAPGSTSSQRINALIKSFVHGKGVTSQGEQFFTGVHATTGSWYTPFKWLRKGRESPGVSFTPLGEGSPRFLRITGGGLRYPSKISLLPKFKMPTAPLLHFKSIVNIPRKYLTDYKAANLFLKQQGQGVFIAPKMYFGGGEYEAVARGVAIRLGQRYYTVIEGVTVPLPEFILSKATLVGKLKTSMSYNIKQFISSYQPSSYVPVLTPSALASALLSSSAPVSPSLMPSSAMSKLSSADMKYTPSIAPSYPSYKPSYTPSYTPSYKPSYTPSYTPSYKPSYTPSYTPSYKPSYTPSYTPSYKPSYTPSYTPSYKPSYQSGYTPYTPKIYPLLDMDVVKHKKKKAKVKVSGIGYRYREWKVPTMDQLLKGW